MISHAQMVEIGNADPEGTVHRLRTCLSDVGVDPKRVITDGTVAIVWGEYDHYKDQLPRDEAHEMALKAWALIGLSAGIE